MHAETVSIGPGSEHCAQYYTSLCPLAADSSKLKNSDPSRSCAGTVAPEQATSLSGQVLCPAGSRESGYQRAGTWAVQAAAHACRGAPQMLILSRQAFEISSPKDLLINVNSNCVASCLRQGLHTGQPYPCSTACGQKASPLQPCHVPPSGRSCALHAYEWRPCWFCCRMAEIRHVLTCDNGGLVMQQALGPDSGAGHEEVARMLTVIQRTPNLLRPDHWMRSAVWTHLTEG